MAEEKKEADKENSKYFDSLIAFLQQKGFVWGPEPEIYNGLAGFYTYAPLGKLLKNNVENEIRKLFMENGFWEVECPTIMQKEVWEASGHLSGFSDAVIQCSKCKSNFRVDTLIQDFSEEQVPKENYLKFIEEKNIKCPNCKSDFAKEIKKHNLMMKTTIGLDTEAYARPETATTTYLPFIRYFEHFRKKLPFGVFQIGKAYRNEISPRQHILRMREFTQAEAQLFIFKEQKDNFEKYESIKDKKLTVWPAVLFEKNEKPVHITVQEAIEKKYFKNKAYAFTVFLAYHFFREIGIPEDKIRLRQHASDEKAFYADDAWDLEVNLKSFGWFECCGIHDRTDYDLKQHSEKSGKDLKAFKQLEGGQEGEKEFPHVLEIAFGSDRPVFALLDIFYEPKEKAEGKSIFKIPIKLSPVKAAIFPLMNKDELSGLAKEVYNLLKDEFICKYDEAGSIGKRYLREAEAGTAFCITIDYNSPINKDVTIRDRDTEEQKRIKISELKDIVRKLIDNEIEFKDV